MHCETLQIPVIRNPQSEIRNSLVARLLYNLIFPFVFLAMLPRFLYRMARRGGYRASFGDRFGKFEAAQAARIRSRPGWTWIRAVSVGEMQIAEKLIRQLRKQNPDLRIVLSTTTSTGHSLAQERFAEALGDWMELIYTPLDFPSFVHAALNLIQPERIVFVEAEVWPNIVALARKRGIRLALVNARLSPRSEGRFRKFRFFTGPVFAGLDAICLAEQEDFEIWQGLGVPRDRLRLTGSIKFDYSVSRLTPEKREEIEAAVAELGWPDRAERLVLMAGSTHSGEEQLLAEIYLRLRERIPQLRLLLAPRHFERAPDIEKELRALGIPSRRRTKIRVPELALVSGSAALPDSPAAEAPVHPPALILDTTGELRQWYSVADVVVIGKSLRSSGGQNPVEVIAAGSALVMGPRMQNFRVVVRNLLAHQAARQVADDAELETVIGQLMTHEPERRQLAANGRAIVEEHHGATARTAEVVLALRS